MSKPTNIGQNMLLHTSYWANKDTFKMMPVTEDCPFTEVIYDPATTLLVVVGRHHKQNFEMVPKLDDNGDKQVVGKGSRPNGSPIKEQRILMDVLHEYYLVDYEEQEAFIKMFAINADSYDYKKYLRNIETEPTIVSSEQSPIIDQNGKPMTNK